jgi:hypothetical protein
MVTSSEELSSKRYGKRCQVALAALVAQNQLLMMRLDRSLSGSA